MGQHFRLVAPHRREILSWGGKLGEILFEGSAADLVSLFARPVIPVEFEAKNSSTTSKPEKSTSQKQVIPQKRRRQSSNPIDMPTPQLIQLPSEIHNLIIELLDIESVFLLGLSCWHFWVLARPVIAEHFAGYLGLWAGTPVICVGDESHRDGKYPDGLLSSEDLDELAKGLEVEELEEGLAESYAEIPVNLYDLANARYTSITEVTTGFPHGLFVLALDLRHKWGSPADITRVVNPKLSSFYPCSEEWVLRNLTTHEFVRPSAIALDQRYIRGPFIKILGYGEVILSKICWSTNDFTSVAGDPLNQGPWAGHALDIVPASYLDDDKNPWKDISDEVSREIAEIWRSEYGENWRNDVVAEWENRYRL
ncbi:conserved hypothetical protein [Histoplasma capsulatum var. duboisii H88]|uniref:F-box domain-containing protein n=2 Tax=Ajellomyces capsulatus TaxID=5037 RepID=C6H3D4_AJECH|nr:conserved hypothetical protein [Histoplasma capsulatum H143]EGC50039.1 conserved hypothetical protein [Histoplasma capsulatum var. duboisii H88]QSS50763.1 putative F-box domain-containing protein [Histoplasma capsulatum var. duboisii H88]